MKVDFIYILLTERFISFTNQFYKHLNRRCLVLRILSTNMPRAKGTMKCAECDEIRPLSSSTLISSKSEDRRCFQCTDSKYGHLLTYYIPKQGEKNTSSLDDNEIFTLDMRHRLKTENYFSFIEWGRARELDKYLVLLLPKKPESKWDQEMMEDLVNHSLNSFDVARDFLKDSIIRCHPKLKLQTFAEYEDYLYRYLNQ